MPEFNDENEATFTKIADWNTAVARLDSILKEWEISTQMATDKEISRWSTEIANMNAHNAYHIGQIIYIRKRNGWWGS